MLKHTGIELELLTDVEMLLFIQRAIRVFTAPIDMLSKFMRSNFNPFEPESYIFYNDINRQYGKAISVYL